MKSSLLYKTIVLLALILMGSCADRSKNDKDKTDQYELVWADEFDYKGKPDRNKWGYEEGFIRNNEKQYYTSRPENIRVDNGYLVIETKKELYKNKDFESLSFDDKPHLHYIPKIDSAQYTSASISTEGKVSWKFGKILVRAKLPEGRGLWPAIWMLGENRRTVGWPKCGEIDIMEHVGYDRDSIFGTIHTEAYNHMTGTQKGKRVFVEKPYDAFHEYGIEWTPEKIDFLLDGTVFHHIENEHKTWKEWPFDQNFYLKMNIAVGGGLGGKKGIDDGVFPQQMLVDYVRVYKKQQ